MNETNIKSLEYLTHISSLDNLECGVYFREIYDKIFNNTNTNTNNKDNNMYDIDKCKQCKNNIFMEDVNHGIIVCSKCGQVKDKLYDCRNELRAYDDDARYDKRAKVTNELLPVSSLGTMLPSNIKGNIRNLQNWNAMPYKERTLYKDRKSTRLNSSHLKLSRMPSSA